MALFGRRKPGFSKEETVKPSEIPGEFNDALDPATQGGDHGNPKFREKTEYTQKADAVLNSVEQPSAPKQDLLDYMESLPEVDDPFPPSEPDPEPAPAPEKTQVDVLAGFIRTRTHAAALTPLSDLRKEIENLDELLTAMSATAEYATIVSIPGEKDTYYYDNDIMTDNYARIAMLIADKDIPRTIAEMVRWNCKTYPSPTPLAYFSRHPYYLTKPQLELALRHMEKQEKYNDIKHFDSAKGTYFLYSDQVLSARYARALADGAEDDENG